MRRSCWFKNTLDEQDSQEREERLRRRRELERQRRARETAEQREIRLARRREQYRARRLAPTFCMKYSGVARKSPLLGHSMGTLCLYELPREVQKLIYRGVWGHPPPPQNLQILQPPRSVPRPYTVAKC